MITPGYSAGPFDYAVMMNTLVTIYIIFGWAMVVLAVVVVVQGFTNWHFVRKRIWQVRPPHDFTPPVELISPCCGMDHGLEHNLRSLLTQDYPDYRVIFTIAEQEDSAVPIIQKLIDEFGPERACLVVAGRAENCAQKVHNQLQAIRQGSRGAAVLAFADSDANPDPKWLRHMVDPLIRPSVGIVTGYRLYVPIRQNLPSITLSVLNAVPAGGLGPHDMNHAWGGAMAIRREYFDKLKIADIWSRAITDDLTMTNAAKKAGYKVVFEPKCYCPSHDLVSWSGMFEFVRRQFIITRVCSPSLWLLALGASLQHAVAFWGGVILSIWGLATAYPNLHSIWLVPLILYIANVIKGFLRRAAAFLALPDHKDDLNPASWVDIFASPLVNLVMLYCIVASALTNTIVWRGITYRLHHAGRTEIVRG